MNTPSAKLRLWYIAAGVLALIGAAWRTVALLVSFDRALGYFQETPLTILMYIFAAAALVAMLALFLFIKKDALSPTPAPTTLPSRCSAGICALLMLLNFIGATSLLDAFRLPLPLWLMGLLFLLAGTVYFALRLLSSKQQTGATLLCGYGAILALALLLCFTYFDQFTQMNAPHKTELHLSLLAAMFFLIYELRDLADAPMPRARAVSRMIAFFLCLSVGASNLIAFLAGVYDSVPYLLQDLLLIALAVYSGTRSAEDALSGTDISQ